MGNDRIALLTMPAKPGGAELRFMALHEALDTTWGCERIQIGCNRRGVCRSCCRTTSAQHENPGRVWRFDRLYCAVYAERLMQQLESLDVDVVVCSTLDLYRYALLLTARGRWKVVFDCHNVEAELYRVMKANASAGSNLDKGISPEYVDRVAHAERAAVWAADEVWTCSESDRQLLASCHQLPPTANIRVVPNALTVGVSPPEPVAPCRICFIGRLDYHPNIEAARFLIDEVAPLLRAEPDPLPIVLAGADPGPELDDVNRADGIELIANPACVADLLHRSIMAVPLTDGGGSRFKVLEAFRAGAAVVSTAKGVEGLAVQEDIHYLRAETAADFRTAIAAVSGDQHLRGRLVTAGAGLVRDRYSTAALAAAFAREGV